MAAHRSVPSRRDLFRLIATGGVLGAVAGDRVTASSGPRPRNIVFMVADGMSAGIPSLAEPFSNLVRGRGTRWAALARDARTARGWCDTASLGSLVTDSSAASTAWATGSRVFNGAVNVLPNGTRLTPIGILARQAGLRVGLVTTTTITHATPAGFVAIQARRDQEDAIAAQYLNTVDVLLGGGRQFFDGARRADRRDLLSEFRAAGYVICDSRRALSVSTRPNRLLGLFADGHLPYVIDAQQAPSTEAPVPSLQDMAVRALDVLHGARRGFLLQVEGGRVDHAAHANDAAGALWEMLAFDDALGAVLEYAKKTGDTLVVVTSDHGNSNPGLNGIGEEYAGSTKGLESLARHKASSGSILLRLRQERDSGGRVSASRASDIVRDLCGLSLSAQDAATVAAIAGESLPTEINKQHANALGILAEVLGNYTGIGWTGTSHTSDVTMVLAVGPGQEAFAGLRRNTETFTALTSLLGIAFVNPAMSIEEAQRHRAARLDDVIPHWL
jgi:alkaline phosphatase